MQTHLSDTVPTGHFHVCLTPWYALKQSSDQYKLFTNGLVCYGEEFVSYCIVQQIFCELWALYV